LPSGTGAITDSFDLPQTFVSNYSVVATQDTAGGTITATSSFTDQAIDFTQCQNGAAPSPNTDGCDANATDWGNGNLGASKSNYFEGDTIPYRIVLSGLSAGAHTLTIAW